MIGIYKMQIAALTTENIGLKAQLAGNAIHMAAQEAELAALRAYVASIAADVEYIELRTPMLGDNVVMLPGAKV
jgi:hypothetical protein